jgi:hypothetical protein
MGLCDEFPHSPCVYLTVIRDPVSRALSYYQYFCTDGAENRHKWTSEMRKLGECNMSPLEWFQTMRTSPFFLQERLTRACDPECGVQAAKHNLFNPCMRYLLVERFQDGLERLKRTFGRVFAPAVDAYLNMPRVKNSNALRVNFTSKFGVQQLQALKALLKEDEEVYTEAVAKYKDQWDQPIVSCNYGK